MKKLLDYYYHSFCSFTSWSILFLTFTCSPFMEANTVVIPPSSNPNNFPIGDVFEMENHVEHINFALIHQLILVEATVNQQTGYFIIDTGAPNLVLNAPYFDTFDIPATKKEISVGVTGTSKNVRATDVAHFQFHSCEKRNFRARCIDLTHLEGVLDCKLLGLIGHEVLQNFELLIDYPQQRLTFFNLDAQGNRIDQTYSHLPDFMLDFEYAEHLPLVKAKVGKSKLKLAIDTGASTNLMDNRLRRKLWKFCQFKNMAKLNGTTSQQKRVLRGNINDLNVNGLKYYNLSAVFTELPNLRKEAGGKIDGLLGYEFLKYRRTAINFKKQQLYFWSGY
ncbi:MAG: retroviral-like aspartic protease family protein [Chitinophagales bacterium]